MANDMPRCPYCGRTFPRYVALCDKCRIPLVVGRPEVAEHLRTALPTILLVGGAMLLLLLLAGIVAYSYFFAVGDESRVSASPGSGLPSPGPGGTPTAAPDVDVPSSPSSPVNPEGEKTPPGGEVRPVRTPAPADATGGKTAPDPAAQAERDAREKAEREAREKAERERREKAAREARRRERVRVSVSCDYAASSVQGRNMAPDAIVSWSLRSCRILNSSTAPSGESPGVPESSGGHSHTISGNPDYDRIGGKYRIEATLSVRRANAKETTERKFYEYFSISGTKDVRLSLSLSGPKNDRLTVQVSE